MQGWAGLQVGLETRFGEEEGTGVYAMQWADMYKRSCELRVLVRAAAIAGNREESGLEGAWGESRGCMGGGS